MPVGLSVAEPDAGASPPGAAMVSVRELAERILQARGRWGRLSRDGWKDRNRLKRLNCCCLPGI